MSKKYLVTLTDEDAVAMEVAAGMHGRKPTNFAEYLIRVQIGALQEVQPVKVLPLREPTAKDTKAVAYAEDFSGSVRHVTFAEVLDMEELDEIAREAQRKDAKVVTPAEVLTKAEPVKEIPRKVAAHVIPSTVFNEVAQEGKPAQIPAQGFTINKDVNAYKDRVEAGIFTDGKHFFVNKFGTKTFHTSLESARIAKA